jgi:hypothetical protein
MEILGFSVGIGIYQGCFRSKQLTTNEFLIADGRMRVMTGITNRIKANRFCF